MAKRWIGDLSTCFLLEDGWAFRVKVNRFQLKGKPGWQMPVSVGEALALDHGQRVALRCSNEGIDHTLVLERRADALVGSEIDLALRRLSCQENDLAFFAFRPDCYRVVVRHQHEHDPQDPLGSLLWHCGLDPHDDEIRARPWQRLARAIGGTGNTPDAVEERLRARGDKRLAALLTEAAAQGRTGNGLSIWPPFWQFVLPDQDDGDRFVLQRPDGWIRTALGVLDGSAQPPRDLTLGEGGTIWLTLSPADDLGLVDALLESPPAGLVPSAARPSWVRWMRADHAARRAALLGTAWCVERGTHGWRLDGAEDRPLEDALLSLRASEQKMVSRPPRSRVQSAYPRNGLAFAAAVRRACTDGLVALFAADETGYRAMFADGRAVEGVSLVDVLTA